MFEGENPENGWGFYAFEGSFPEIRATDWLKAFLTGFFIIKFVGFFSLKLTLTYSVATFLSYYKCINLFCKRLYVKNLFSKSARLGKD